MSSPILALYIGRVAVPLRRAEVGLVSDLEADEPVTEDGLTDFGDHHVQVDGVVQRDA